MKKFTRPTRFSIAFVLVSFVLILACSKDFEDVILDDFDFNFTGENAEESFLFESTRTSFSLVPEKEISTVNYFLKYATTNSRGYFLTMEGDTIRANDTLNITDRNWNYNYVAIDTGLHQVKFLAWDSNKNQKELALTYKPNMPVLVFCSTKGLMSLLSIPKIL